MSDRETIRRLVNSLNLGTHKEAVGDFLIRLAQEVDDLKGDVSNIQGVGELGGLTGRVQALENADLDGRVSVLEGKVEALEGEGGG